MVENTKRVLSSTYQGHVIMEAPFDGAGFSEAFVSARFEEINNDFFKNTQSPVEQKLEDSNPKQNQVNEILRVNSSTRILRVKQLIDFFNGKGHSSLLKDCQTKS